VITGKAIVAIVAMFVAGFGAVVNAFWGPRARARRRLDRARRTTIADREIVTLTGVVRAVGEPLTAPVSGKPCVVYEASARVYGDDARHNTRDLLGEFAEARMLAFDLETDGGLVRVEGENAELELSPVPIIPRKLDRELAFLRANGWSSEQLRNAGFDEVRVEPGDKIRVQGMAIVELDPSAPEGGYRDGSRKVRLVAHEGHPLTIGRAR
jgi:hypothetical protein